MSISTFITSHVISILESELMKHEPEIQAAFIAEIQSIFNSIIAKIEELMSKKTGV